MSQKVEQYRQMLRATVDWEALLLRDSHLPGPRSNLELMEAAADVGSEAQFRAWTALDAETAPGDAPLGFLAMCGAVGLGRLLAEGESWPLARLRELADDSRWRVREATAMALQRWGRANFAAFDAALRPWETESLLARRAVVAARCEPDLLARPEQARAALAALERITAGFAGEANRRDADFRTLRQALGYGWSVAVVALPAEGLPLLEALAASADLDARWVFRENLKKARLARVAPEWAARYAGIDKA